MERVERVKRAIRFDGPDRVPVWNLNRDQREGDVLCHALGLEVEGRNEWGYRLEQLEDGTMGHPGAPLLPDWEAVGNHPDPSFRGEERLGAARAFVAEAEGYYRLGSLGISGFTVYMFLRGFGHAVTDSMLYPEACGALLDRIFAFETRQIEMAGEAGMDGVHFADDWGSQEGLLIDPVQWRAVFKERYRAQFERAHAAGLEVWFHCCGNFGAIVEDFHEIGVDVLNISQPNVVDIAGVGKIWRGKQCFMLPISYQTVGISGTSEEILTEGRRLYEALGTPEGGFIGYVEEYGCMGMSEVNYQSCRRAFEGL